MECLQGSIGRRVVGACLKSQRWTASPEEVVRRLREQTRRWRQQELLRPCLSSGSASLDAWLGGGWPLGKVCKLVGPYSAGRTTAAVTTVAAATARGEVVAWVDMADALDPASLAAAGVDLERVLWVRPATPEQAVRAVELVLEVGGFTVVVVDLAPTRRARQPAASGKQEDDSDRRSVIGEPRFDHPSDHRPPPTDHEVGGWVARRFSDHRSSLTGRRRGGWGALALRLVRAVERARVVALLLVEQPWAAGLAGVTVHLQGDAARWLGGVRNGPRWLAGVALRPVAQGPGAGGQGRGGSDRWSVVGEQRPHPPPSPPLTGHRSPLTDHRLAGWEGGA